MPAIPIALMLATLTDRRDFGDDWLLERKFDGERCVARKSGVEVLVDVVGNRPAGMIPRTHPLIEASAAAMAPGEAACSGEKITYDASATWKTPSTNWLSTRTANSRRNQRPCSRCTR